MKVDLPGKSNILLLPLRKRERKNTVDLPTVIDPRLIVGRYDRSSLTL